MKKSPVAVIPSDARNLAFLFSTQSDRGTPRQAGWAKKGTGQKNGLSSQAIENKAILEEQNQTEPTPRGTGYLGD
jgi:hypothetical protein